MDFCPVGIIKRGLRIDGRELEWDGYEKPPKDWGFGGLVILLLC